MKKTTILSVVGMAWLSIVAGCGPVSQNSSVLEISDSSSQISSEQAAKLDAALQRDVAATEDYFWGRAERAATTSFHVELRKRAELRAAQFPPETIFSEQELEDLKSQLSLLRQVNVKSRAVGFIYRGESISLEEANQRYASDQERYRQVFVPASEAVQTYLNKYIEKTGWDVVGQALKPANARAMIGFKDKRKSDSHKGFWKPRQMTAEESINEYRKEPRDHMFRNPFDSGKIQAGSDGTLEFVMPNAEVWALAKVMGDI